MYARAPPVARPGRSWSGVINAGAASIGEKEIAAPIVHHGVSDHCAGTADNHSIHLVIVGRVAGQSGSCVRLDAGVSIKVSRAALHQARARDHDSTTSVRRRMDPFDAMGESPE